MMAIRKTLQSGKRYRSGIPWNDHETTVLRRLYADHSDAELAACLGRSEWAVKGKARNLGLVRTHQEHPGCLVPHPSRAWSPTEIRLLKRLHQTTPYEEIADLIGRTRNAVHMKARKLGLHKMDFWTEKEDQFLEEHHRTLSYEEIGEILGRSEGAVKARAITLGLDCKAPRWTEEETRSLAAYYGSTASDTMSVMLGRTRRALLQKAHREGLLQKSRWSMAEAQRLVALLPDHTAREIASLIGRSHNAVRYKIQQLRSNRNAGVAGQEIADCPATTHEATNNAPATGDVHGGQCPNRRR